MVSNRAVIEIVPTVPGMMPTQSYPGDAGWDLYVAHDVLLEPMESTDIPCGFDIALPEGFWGRVASRSSTMRKHKIVIGDAVIDSGYRGPMFVNAMALERVQIFAGWRLAQLIIHRIEPVYWREVPNLMPSERGSKSYGSSGT